MVYQSFVFIRQVSTNFLIEGGVIQLSFTFLYVLKFGH